MRELPEGTDVDVDVTVWSADTAVVWSPTAVTVVTVVGVGDTSEALCLRGLGVIAISQALGETTLACFARFHTRKISTTT